MQTLSETKPRFLCRPPSSPVITPSTEQGKRKVNPLPSWTGPQGFRNLRIPEILDNRHMKMARLSALFSDCLYPQGKISGTHFCQRLSRIQGHSATGRIKSMKNPNYHNGNRVRDLPACSVVPNEMRHRVTLYYKLRHRHRELMTSLSIVPRASSDRRFLRGFVVPCVIRRPQLQATFNPTTKKSLENVLLRDQLLNFYGQASAQKKRTM